MRRVVPPLIVLALASIGLDQIPAVRAVAPPPRADGISPELRAKFEAESSAAWRKMRRAVRKSSVETTLTVVPIVKGFDTREGARMLKKMYRGRPGFAVAALPTVRCLLLRADAKTKEEAIRLTHGVRPRGSGKPGW